MSQKMRRAPSLVVRACAAGAQLLCAGGRAYERLLSFRETLPHAAVVKYDEPEEIETALGFIAIPTTTRPLFPGEQRACRRHVGSGQPSVLGAGAP